MVSTYPQRAKAANARRDPRVSILIHSDEWDGPYVQVDGTAEVIDMPDAVEPLVDYFRCISGEHPDWDEYRDAMRTQNKSLIRITVERWGPVATGGFPPDRRLSCRHLEPAQQLLGAGQVRERRRRRCAPRGAARRPARRTRRPCRGPGRLRLRQLRGGGVVGGELVEPVLPAVEVGVAQRPAAELRGPAEPLGDVEDPAVGRRR